MGGVDDRVHGVEAGLKREAQDRARAGLAISLTAFALGVPEPDVRCVTRGANASAYARAVAMYLVHAGFGMSLARVGLAFRRDRSTVAHACRRIENQRDDARFDAWVCALEAALRYAPQPTAALEITVIADLSRLKAHWRVRKAPGGSIGGDRSEARGKAP